MRQIRWGLCARGLHFMRAVRLYKQPDGLVSVTRECTICPQSNHTWERSIPRFGKWVKVDA